LDLASGVFGTDGKPTIGGADTYDKFSAGIVNTMQCHLKQRKPRALLALAANLSCSYLLKFSLKIVTVLIESSGAQGKMIHKKT
jgi:hypothetical protein